MEHHGNPELGSVFSLISIISAFLAFISIKDVQAIFTLIASAVAIVSGGFAIRYYYLAIKEKKRVLKDN